MALSIRLTRVGRRKSPFYRVVVADRRMPRDGRFVEIIGHYQPLKAETKLEIKEERALYWLNVGAQPSDTVRSLMRKKGIMKRWHEARVAIKRARKGLPPAKVSVATSVEVAAPAAPPEPEVETATAPEETVQEAEVEAPSAPEETLAEAEVEAPSVPAEIVAEAPAETESVAEAAVEENLSDA